MVEKNDMYLKNALTFKPIIKEEEFVSACKVDFLLAGTLTRDIPEEKFFTIRQFKKELDEALEIVKLRAEANGTKSVYNVYLEAGINTSNEFNAIDVHVGKLVNILIISNRDMLGNNDLLILLIVGDNYNCFENFKEVEKDLLDWQSYIHEPIDTKNRICYTTNGLRPQIVDDTHDFIYNMGLFGESLLRNYLLNSIERDGKEYTIMLDPSKENNCDFVRDNTYTLVAVEELLKVVDVIK